MLLSTQEQSSWGLLAGSLPALIAVAKARVRPPWATRPVPLAARVSSGGGPASSPNG